MHRFEERDSEEILRRALAIDAQQKGSDREAMLAAAREMGISDEALTQAEEQWAKEKEDSAHFREFVRQQRSAWLSHLGWYVGMSVLFFVLDVKDGQLSWFWWPVLGWGLGIFGHTAWLFDTKSKQFQREFREWRQNRALEDR